MLNVKEFIVNASVLIAIIYGSSLVYKQFLGNTPYQVKNVLLLFLAVFSGWVSMFFGIQLDGNVIFDLRFVPLIVVILFAEKPISILLVGMGIGLARFGFGLNEAAVVGFVNVMLLSACGMLLRLLFARWSLKKQIVLSVCFLNSVNLLFLAFYGVMPASAYIMQVLPVVLPMNSLLSFLIVWMVKDLYHEYVSKRNLIESARKDPLTKLYNRRAFMNYYQQFSSERGGENQFVLVFIDIDHFKIINDTYGHLVGDRVLQVLSARLVQHLRKIDIVARYGGEEFVAILPDCSKDQALIVVERIREAVARQPVVCNDIQIPVTFSAGLASSMEFKAEHLLSKADEALYEAKENGRNRIMCAAAEAACS